MTIRISTISDIAAHCDRIATECFQAAAVLLHITGSDDAMVVRLLSLAEDAAEISRDLTPDTAPGTGDALHVPGSQPTP